MLASVGSGALNVVGLPLSSALGAVGSGANSIKSLVYSPPARVVYDDESYESIEIDVDIVRSLMSEIHRRLMGGGSGYSDDNLSRLFKKIEPFFWRPVEDGVNTGSFLCDKTSFGGIEHLVGLKVKEGSGSRELSDVLVFPTDCHKLTSQVRSPIEFQARSPMEFHNGGSKLKEVASANSSNFIEDMYKRDAEMMHAKVNSPEKAINALTCSKKILTAIAKSLGTDVRYFVVLKKWRDYRSEGKYIISSLERNSVRSRSQAHTLPLQIHYKYDSSRQVDKVVASKIMETVGTFGSIRSFLSEDGGEVEVHMSSDQTVLTVLRYR